MSEFRKFIVPKKGHVFLEFDFKQLEVNALAEVTQCVQLIKELNEGVDIHTRNAAEWKKIPETTVDADTRTQAKVLTFQMQYGAGNKSMADFLGIPIKEVKLFKQAFFSRYPEIKQMHDELNKWIRDLNSVSRDQGNLTIPVRSITNRLYKIKPRKDNYSDDSGDSKIYYSATEAKNYPIQGFGTGDLVPVAINMLYDLLDESYFKTMVHDSLLLDISEKEVYTVLTAIEEVFYFLPMKFKELFNYNLQVKYDYDISIGGTWKELKEPKHSYNRGDVIHILKDQLILGESYDCYRYYN